MLFFQIGFAYAFGAEEIKPNSKLAVLFIVLAIIVYILFDFLKQEPTTTINGKQYNLSNSIITTKAEKEHSMLVNVEGSKEAAEGIRELLAPLGNLTIL